MDRPDQTWMATSGPLSPAAERGQLAETLPSDELERLIVDLNDTVRPYPRDRCVHELVQAQAVLRPEAVAVTLGDAHLSYDALNRRANRLAHRLRSLGVGPEVLVGVCLERSLQLPVALLAVLKAGGAYVPIDPAYPAERIAFMLEDGPIPVLVTVQALAPRLPAGESQVVVVDAADLAAEPDIDPPCLTIATHLAYVMYTSGSTGRPKGVEIPHRAILRLVCNSDFVRLEPSFRLLQVASASFDALTFEVWGALVNGGEVVCIDRDLALSPRAFAAWLEVHRIDAMFLTVTLFNLVVAEVPWAFRSVRNLLVGGEALNPHWIRVALEQGPPARLLNGYGPTESTTFACSHLIDQVPVDARSIPIGRPIANTRVYVLDERLEPVPVGVPGELYIGGDGLARGYHRRPELTRVRFIPDPFLPGTDERMYRTGDLACHRPDGTIDFLGRIDQQVKIRGFRIEPGEIEAALTNHPAVQDAVVVARADRHEDLRLVAYVIPKQGQAVSASELRAHLARQLPTFMLPAAIVDLERFPLNPNGKLDRAALPAPDARLDRSVGSEAAPRTPLEAQLASQWAQLLGLPTVGIHDNFFALGGHSLLALRTLALIRERFGLELSPGRFFRAPTVAALAAAIGEANTADERTGKDPAPIGRAARDGLLPLSFPQQQVWFLEQLAPGNIAYHFQMTLELRGRLDVDALERSFTEIVRRHEILRTTFHALEGQPVQRIHPPFPVAIPRVDLRGIDPDLRDGEAERRIQAELAAPFDVTRLPLFRLMLFQLEADRHLLLQIEHHFVHDGWSIAVLLRELTALYTGFATGAPVTLPELPLQFADFAAWQHRWFQGARLERELAWWKERLRDRPPRLELPMDRPRPARNRMHGAVVEQEISAALAERVRDFCRLERTTLFVVLLATFKTLLLRDTGQEDILIGTGAANRTRRELEPLIGMVVNTLVLRTDLSRDPTFLELLDRVRDVVLETHAHADLPLDRLVAALHVARELGRNPLFQVMFNFHNAAVPELEMPGLSATVRLRNNGSAKFDLNLIVVPVAEQRLGQGTPSRAEPILLLWEYNTDLFDAVTIERMAARFVGLLEAVVSAPGLRLSLLIAVSGTGKPLPGETPPGVSQGLESSPAVVEGRVPETAPRADADDRRPDSLERLLECPLEPILDSELEPRLIELWRQLLGVSPIGVHDSFFELGGHSLLAARLFAQIERVFGRSLPLVCLFERPTVAHLAEQLRRGNAAGEISPIVPIQPSGSGIPFFAVHAIAGTVFCYQKLAGYLGPEQPFFGIQGRGLDGRHPPFKRLEDMATWYVEAITASWPEGPIALGGYSAGASIAYEMAQQLHARGRPVALLAFFDSSNPRSGFHDAHWRPDFLYRALCHLPVAAQEVLSLPAHERLERVRIKIQMATMKLGLGKTGAALRKPWESVGPNGDIEVLPPVHRVFRETLFQALEAYELKRYPGRITLFRARFQPMLCSHDPWMGWGNLAGGGVKVCEVPGEHSTVLQEPHVRAVARELRACLSERTGLAGSRPVK